MWGHLQAPGTGEMGNISSLEDWYYHPINSASYSSSAMLSVVTVAWEITKQLLKKNIFNLAVLASLN